MTIGEKRHQALEARTAARLEAEGLSLIRAGGLYEVIDQDGMRVTAEPLPLAEIVGFMAGR